MILIYGDLLLNPETTVIDLICGTKCHVE